MESLKGQKVRVTNIASPQFGCTGKVVLDLAHKDIYHVQIGCNSHIVAFLKRFEFDVVEPDNLELVQSEEDPVLTDQQVAWLLVREWLAGAKHPSEMSIQEAQTKLEDWNIELDADKMVSIQAEFEQIVQPLQDQADQAVEDMGGIF
jgi:hypothetical protein